MAHYATYLKTGPTVEPMEAAEAKLHLRVDIAADDSLIEKLITAARRNCELYTGRQMLTATWQLILDEFPSEILVPKPPLQSVGSVKYVDEDGATQTLSSDNYDVDLYSLPPRIYPAYDETWPTTRAHKQAVTVEFDSGYGDAATSVPGDLISGMKLLIGHLYEHREAVIVGTGATVLPMAVEELWSYYRTYVEN